VTCTPGAKQCSTTGVPQLCSSTGTWQNQTACSPPSCSLVGGVYMSTPQSTCQTGGVCSTPASTPCTNGCDGTACASATTKGGACTATSQCAAGLYCTDGVCCTSSSCGTCASCNLTNPGTCSNKAPGATDSACPASASTCQAGGCDGNGNCTPAAPGSSCGSGKVCSGGNCQSGCWIGGNFFSSGTTGTNACQICSPAKSTSAWSNNDGVTVSCACPGATAPCVNGAPGSCSQTASTYWQDHDGDGYGNPLVASVSSCTPISGWVTQAGDCDDNNFTDKPGATECETYDANTLTTCSSSGTWVTSTCSNGCAGGQCRTFPFPTMNVAGTVSCSNIQCPASQGCSFGVAAEWTSNPACGAPFKDYHATCDGQNDCPGQQCCWIFSGGSDAGVGCFPSGTCPHFQMGSNAYLICDPNQAGSCPAGSTCTMLNPYSTYYCQPN
jgi:hypothetical protein